MRDWRALTIGEIADAMLKVLFNKETLLLLGVYACLSLPALYFLITGLIASVFQFFLNLFSNSLSNPYSQLPFTGEAPNGLLIFFLALYYFFVTLLYTLMSTDLYGRRFMEGPYRLIPSLRAQLKNIPGYLLYLFFQFIYYLIIYFFVSIIFSIFSMFAAGLMMAGGQFVGTLIIGVFFLLFFVVLIEAAGVFIFGVLPALAIDRGGLFPSIGRSFKLSVKNFFKIFGTGLLLKSLVMIALYFLNWGVNTAINFVIGAPALINEQGMQGILMRTVVFYCFLILLSQVASAALNTVLYCNQKIRHEGLGAELLVNRFLEENPPEGGETRAV